MIVLVDNFDSFTFNLYQLLASAGAELRVIRSDEMTPAAIAALRPGRVVLSPGPGHPAMARTCLELPQQLPATPILGVCLGHQAMALAYGATVSRAPRPRHGRTVAVRHDGRGLFQGLPDPLDAALYHSLAVEEDSLPSCLEACAWSSEGDLMGFRHRQRPHVGVQFHPESCLTTSGMDLARRFLEAS